MRLTPRPRPPGRTTTGSSKFWNGEQRELSRHMLPSVQRARSTQAQTSACAALRRPSVCDDRRSTVRRPNQNYRILPSQTQTGETSIHKLSELTLPLSSYAASVPPSDHRVLIDRLIVILDYVWLHPARSTRRVHSAWRVSCLVSTWTFFRSLSPSRTHSGSQTGSWIGMSTQIRAVNVCDKYI